MIKKSELIKYLGGTAMNAACQLGYDVIRPDNNITRLPDILTKRQQGVILMRMKANRIPIPDKWLK
jgi:hypothetical protein